MARLTTSIDDVLGRALRLSADDAWKWASGQGDIHVSIKGWLHDQLREGKNENDQIIGVYSQATEIITGGAKRAGSPITLRDTGSFWDSFYIIFTSNTININAYDIKTDSITGEQTRLLERYGEGVIGLNEDHMNQLSELILEEYIDYVRHTLQIN